jgi:hypothetical protein
MRSFAVLFLLAVAVTAQERPKPLPEIQALLDAAPAAPPELAADILLKLVDSGRIPSKEQRLEIVDQAFQLAGQAKFPYMQSAAVDRAGHTDSSPGIRDTGLGEGLSTMGLRCRAVRAALNIDKAKALELFHQVVVGPFPPLSCDDALAPELSQYYLVLHEVASKAYPPKDMKEGRHFELIETAVRNVATPRQLTPVAKLLAEFPMPPDRKTELVGTYAAALKRMDADPRSFGAVTVELGNALDGLSKKLQIDEISTVPLADAFRAYMARHLQGALCAETANPKGGGRYMRQVVDKFLNEGVIATAAAAEVPPLKFDELKPKSVLGSAKFSDYWRENRSREIMARFQELRFGTKEQQEEYSKLGPRRDRMAPFLPEPMRRAPEWEAAVRQFIEDLDHWSKNHDEPEIDFFHMMCFQYMALLETIPDGSLHDAVLRTYISYLKSSPMERESPPEWLIHVRRLFSITDATPDHLDRVRAEIRRSGSLTMSLYAELARLDALRAARGNRN